MGHDVIWDSMLEDLRLRGWSGGRRGERDRKRGGGEEKREEEEGGNVSTTSTLILFIRGK